MSLATTLNFSNTTPAAPTGHQNVTWQNDGGTPTCNESAYDPVMVGDSGSGGSAGNVPAPAAGDAAAGKFLKADGTFAVPPGSSGITQLTGDVTAGPGSGSQAATLAASGVTAGSYTSANITVDAKGRLTAAADGAGGGSISVDGETVSSPNLSSDAPVAPPEGFVNVRFAVDGSNVSGYVPNGWGDPIALDSLAFFAKSNASIADLQPSNFVTTAEAFASSSGQFTTFTEGTQGAFSVSSGNGIITNTGAETTIVAQNASAFTLPQAFVSVDVVSGGTDSATSDYVGVGLVKDGSNLVMGQVDRIRDLALIEIRIGGTSHTASISYTPPSAPYKLGLSLVGTSAVLYINTGSAWTYLTAADTRAYYDFRTAGNMAGWMGGFMGGNGGSGSVWHFSTLNIGYFGCVSVRDINIVTNLDGTPYIDGETIYFTATCADGAGTSDSAFSGYLGIFSYNVSTGAVAETGLVMSSRNSGIFNDQAGQVIFDPTVSGFRYLASTWANGPSYTDPLGIAYGTSTAALLTGFTAVATAMLSLPGIGGGDGSYDPFLIWDTVNARWMIAYTVSVPAGGSTFYPAAAYSPDLSTWTLIAADSVSGAGYEQTKIIPSQGSLYVVSGGPNGTGDSSRVYDITMTFLGALDATFTGGGVTNPGAAIAVVGQTAFLLTWEDTKFDSNSFTWGNFVVMTAPAYTGLGVQSINGNTGAMTFNGSGVSQSGNTFTFAGGGGGAGFSPYPSSFSTPLSADFTQENFSGSNVYDRTGRMVLVPGSTTLASLVSNTALPSTPYTIDLSAGLLANFSTGGNTFFAIGLLDSSNGKLMVYQFRQGESINASTPYINCEQWTNYTTYGGVNQFNLTPSFMNNALAGLRITDDGTHRTYWISDNGQDFFQVFQEATGAFISPDSVVLIGSNNSGGAAVIKFYNFLVSDSILAAIGA